MSWNDKDDKSKKKMDKYFVSRSEEERYEGVAVLAAIKRKYGNKYADKDIQAAIEQCFDEVPAPRPRDKFTTCVLARLG